MRVWPKLGHFGLVMVVSLLLRSTPAAAGDHIRDLQMEAARTGRAEWGHWGLDPERYSTWGTHSNRLIPLYSFGIKLDSVKGSNSVYRDAERLKQLYGRLPENTLNPDAEYFDQTDIFRLQKQALDAGKKYIILIIFDGMDWQTTWAAAISHAGKVGYREGRGTGLLFQDYRGFETDYGLFVTSPELDEAKVDAANQTVAFDEKTLHGGYDWRLGGLTPWQVGSDPAYLLGQGAPEGHRIHAFTDSAASATSMTSGIKTYNEAINVDSHGRQVPTIAHLAQERGYRVGLLTSVPFSHATPAAGYAHNVTRNDYHNIARDELGLPSAAHPKEPLPGADVVMGAGWGAWERRKRHEEQEAPKENKYVVLADLEKVDVTRGGKYRVVQRTPGQEGTPLLMKAAHEAAEHGERFCALFGGPGENLPFRTADGGYDPVSVKKNDDGTREVKSGRLKEEDIRENPTLADMTRAALTVLEKGEQGFWFMIESGDVDWANHSNNIDDSIGAVISGDAAFKAVTEWVETRQAWKDTVVLLTADHGHYLVIEKPEALMLPAGNRAAFPP